MVVLEKDIKSRINRYRTLSQYKGFSEKQLREVAIKNAKKSKKIKDKKIEGEYLDKHEQDRAQLIYDEYLAANHIESPVELDTLKNLVQIRIWLQRMELKIKKLNKKDDFSNKNLMNDYLALMNKRKEIEKDLGLFTNKKEGWLNFWQKYLKKLKLYVLSHRGMFVFKCPKCQNLALIVRKISDYDTFDFTMFRGTVLFNVKLMEFIDSGKLTIREVSEIWGLPRDDYVKGIYEKIYLPEKRKNLIENKEKFSA